MCFDFLDSHPFFVKGRMAVVEGIVGMDCVALYKVQIPIKSYKVRNFHQQENGIYELTPSVLISHKCLANGTCFDLLLMLERKPEAR